MCAQFSEDDVGKRVVNENGEEVGMITAVEHGTGHVEPDPGITDTIKAKLGWQDRDEEAYPLQEAAVERITDDEVRLTGGLGDTGGTATGSGTTGTGTSTGSETTTGTGSTDDNRGGGDMVPTEGGDAGPTIDAESAETSARDTDVGDDSGTRDDTGMRDESGTRDEDSGLTDDDEGLIGSSDENLIDDKDSGITEDDRRRANDPGTRDEDSGLTDDEGLIGDDDDDDLIGDDDDEGLIGDDDDDEDDLAGGGGTR